MLDNQPLDKMQALQLAAALIGGGNGGEEAVAQMFALAKLIREHDRRTIQERIGSIKPVNPAD